MSIKIRLQKDLRTTVDIIQRAERCGVEWITVHGRTPSERSQHKVHLNAISFIKSIASVPIIANGDIFNVQTMDQYVKTTNVDGIMCARGALANPAIFAGIDMLPLEGISQYMDYALQYGGSFAVHHHHVMFMMFGRISKADRRELSMVRSMAGLSDLMQRKQWWSPPSRDHSGMVIGKSVQSDVGDAVDVSSLSISSAVLSSSNS
jgi:tRNA-dihydrouridine synthase 4